ncbi:MAG: tryptophan--tRNA ligase [Patescibacteria group bacterium]
MKHVVFSGIQPSGQLHIGNYFGALKGWLELQADPDNECVFAVVDYHALTEGPKPTDLRQRIFDVSVDFLAAGLDPHKSTILIQSFVNEHTDLAWILNCITPVSWLERVPTFKDKAQQFRQNINMGLLDYPVLMAADILLYKATIVPVGQDQFAHLELAREIARAFNAKYGQTFPEPKERITLTPKIMSLSDPTKKMSKSYGVKSYLAIDDSPEQIDKKIKSMVTITGNEKDIISIFLKLTKEIHQEFKDLGKKYLTDREVRTEGDLTKLDKKLGDAKFRQFMALYNFYMLLYIFADTPDRKKFLANLENNSIKFSEYKQLLADKVATYPTFVSFRKKRAELLDQPEKVWDTLRQGSERAHIIAKQHMSEIKHKIGLI